MPATPPADLGDPAEGAPLEDVDQSIEALPTSTELAEPAESDEPAAPDTAPEPAPAPPPTKLIDHPTLGPAMAFLDDRLKTRRSLLIAIASAAIGLLGVSMGIGDATNGDGIGVLFGAGGLVLFLYGLNELRVGAMRMAQPVRLVVAERGFDFPAAPGPIGWDEVATLAVDTQPRETEPSSLRARVREPEEFATRHSLSGRARLRLLDKDGWIAIGGGMAMPPEQVLAMMKDLLAESRAKVRPVGSPARRATRRTSRH